MYLEEKIENIRQRFFRTYKHPYIDRQFYDSILSDAQVLFYKSLLQSIEVDQKENLFIALLHMQISLDIHDQVDLQYYEHITDHRSERNQLKVLVGDYHSSYFYRLLSQYNMLDELYHFIHTIKNINESKMAILHNEDRLSTESLLIEVEKVHCGLYDALSSLYQIKDYHSAIKPKLVNHLVYNSSESNWISILKKNHLENIDKEILKRENYWRRSNFIGDK